MVVYNLTATRLKELKLSYGKVDIYQVIGLLTYGNLIYKFLRSNPEQLKVGRTADDRDPA